MRAILFDFAGTLFDHIESAHGDIIIAAAREFGFKVDPSDARFFWSSITAQARSREELALRRDRSQEAFREAWMRLYSQMDALHHGLSEAVYMRATDPSKWIPYYETRPVLRALSLSEIPVGVISDIGWDIRQVFRLNNCDGFVRSFTLSFEHGSVKPDRVLFDHACQALDVRPEDTLMVGDSHETDGGAVDAGLVTLLLPRQPAGSIRGLGAVLAGFWP
jgi:FMN phosphatase YigB (HAD superfamily)